MLIDSLHRRWFLATTTVAIVALGVYAAFEHASPGGLTGGSTVGLWYGAFGSGLMAYAGLLSALRKVPSWWWVGSRQVWMRGHVWLGLLSAVFLLCHSGFHWGGPLERLLWAVTIAVLATGVLGLVLQQVLPRLLLTRVPCEAPYEQVPHLCRVLRQKADALVESVGGPAQLRAFYERDVRPFLAPDAPRSLPLFDALQLEARFAHLGQLPGLEEAGEPLARLAALCEERRLLADQERLHFWLHSWLLLHVPLSAALLVLGVAHAATALYY